MTAATDYDEMCKRLMDLGHDPATMTLKQMSDQSSTRSGGCAARCRRSSDHSDGRRSNRPYRPLLATREGCTDMSDEALARKLGMLREKRKEAQERRDENMDRYMAGEIDNVTWLQTDADMGGIIQALTYAIAVFGDDD